MNFDQIDARIGTHFLSALINGDETGLSDEESREFAEWIARVQDGRAGHWTTDSDTEEFARCEVSGLMSQCANVSFMFPVKCP